MIVTQKHIAGATYGVMSLVTLFHAYGHAFGRPFARGVEATLYALIWPFYWAKFYFF